MIVEWALAHVVSTKLGALLLTGLISLAVKSTVMDFAVTSRLPTDRPRSEGIGRRQKRYFSGRKSSATASCSGTSGKKLSR